MDRFSAADAQIGAPVWADLASSDLTASTSFYGTVLGWGRRDDDLTVAYAYFVSEGHDIGGLRPQIDEVPDAWRIFLKVDDLEATVASAAAAGGRVLREASPAPTSGRGRWALLEDPSGAEIAVWQAESFAGFAAVNVPGAPCWFELHSKDFAAAVSFYERVFGWPVSSVGDSDEFRMVVFGEPTASAGIYDAARDALTNRSQWVIYFAVEDADSTASLVRDGGGTVLDGPTDTPFGRMSHALDSTGAPFTFIRLPAASESGG